LPVLGPPSAREQAALAVGVGEIGGVDDVLGPEVLGRRELLAGEEADEPLVAEGELVAVIGTTVPRRCTRDEAQAAVLGWTIGNDVSARAWQRSDRTFWRCKNSDTFKPMGPYIVTGGDPLSATTTVRVDGEVKASFPTGDMLFDPYDFICAMSRYITLRPGDVVWLGTDETATIVPGQTVEISISGLGTLANPVTEEKQP
jgi:2-keto-4-pentenoate hydratase/2-oxohepta-3-ene-1,7-dioic acid hydratase in catechol pathway